MTEEEACAQALALIPSGTGPITLSELEQHMAKAADLLRGAIDQADFKAYMFPLKFFKGISDVYRSSTCTPVTGASAITTASR